MPIRSNRFQKLVYMIERQLAGQADVKQSVEIPDGDTGKRREVDVVIMVTSGRHRLKIGVEAVSGKGGTPWVESMICKHQLAMLTDKLILVAGKGFSKPAREKARLHGVETVALDKAESTDWAKLVGRYAKLWFATVNLTPKQVLLTTEQLEQPIQDPGLTTKPETILFATRGSRKTTLIHLIHQLLRESQILRTVYDREDRDSLTRFDIDASPADDCYILDNNGNHRRVLKIHVSGSLKFSMSPFDVQTSAYKGAAVGYGELQIDGKEALATIVEEHGKEPAFSVSFSAGENDPGIVVDLHSPLEK